MTKTILLIGTLDTKGDEFAFARDLIVARGHQVLMMDVGVMDHSRSAEIDAAEVALAGGENLQQLREAGDRASALAAMSVGATKLAVSNQLEGKVDGVLSFGGSGGTSVATTAMQALPVGIPKVMLSTMASGDVSSYVGVKDITMMYSVVDVAGLNRISRQVFANAVGAVCGMVEQDKPQANDKPLIAATMFGVTTPLVTMVREQLEAANFEVLVFHATGSGGRAMEALITDGFIEGVADLTTTEWCDELVGGILSAGPTRLDAAARSGTPQVVSLGALDMVNFGGLESVPGQFKDRNLHIHNAQVTLMRTTAGECTKLGEIIANKLNQAVGPTVLFIPLNGLSMIDAEGQPFHGPAENAALFRSLRENLNNKHVELIELDVHINDAVFAEAVSNRLLRMLETKP